MRIRRSLPILLVVVLVAAALTLLVQLRKHAPPEPARLLPGADGFVYVNLEWIRRAKIIDQLPPVIHDPEYQNFLDATGFEFERDLDEAAFAIHQPGVQQNLWADQEPRFTEVLVGRMDGDRVNRYLHKLASSVDSYRSVDIYNIPLEGRTLRVAILGVDTVAASNHPDPQVIHALIDRSRKLASPFGGPAFLRQYYKEVPLASFAWALMRIDPAKRRTPDTGPFDFSFLFTRPAVVVSSLRYLGSVHFRAEAFTASAEEATHVTEQLNTYLGLFHAAENASSVQISDADVKAMLDSLEVHQRGDRAWLQATFPAGFLKKAVAQMPVTSAPAMPPAATPPQDHKTNSK